MKKISSILICLILTCTLAFAFGCSNRDIDDDFDYEELDPNTKVTIDFMHMWPEHRATMEKLVKTFTDKNKNITVNIAVTPYDQIQQVLQTSFISKSLPNVYVFYTHFMNPLVSGSDGVMAGNFNSIVDSIKSDFIQPDAWEMGKINGKYYSVPYRSTGELVFYNKTIFKAKGWAEPSTFEQMEQLFKTISQDGQYVPISASGKENQLNYFINAMSMYCSILDGSVDEPGFKIGRLKPDTTDNTAELIYEKVQNWYANNYFGKGAIAMSKQGAISSFTSRRAAMVFANVNNMGDVKEILSDEIGVFALPAPDQIKEDIKYVFGGYDGLSYSPLGTDDQKKASIMLIKHLASKEMQQEFVNRSKSVVVNKDVIYEDAMLAEFAKACKYIGAYATGVDFVTGDNSGGNGDLISNYIAGTSTQNISDLLVLINNNVWKDMQDALLNDPVKDWYDREKERKNFDKSWLS